MKNIVEKSFLTGIIGFLLLFVIANLSLISQESGWVNKGDYLEQKLKVGSISFIRLSKDGNHFFTYSNDKYLRKWNIETGLLISADSIPYTLNSFDLSPDENFVALSYGIGINIRNNSPMRCDTIIIYDLKYSKEIYRTNPEGIVDYGTQSYCNGIESIVSFIYDSMITTSTKIKKGWWYGTDEEIGTSFIINFQSNTKSNIADYPMTYSKVSFKKKYITFISNVYNRIKIGQAQWESINGSSLNVFNLDENIISRFYDVGFSSEVSNNWYQSFYLQSLRSSFFSNDEKYVFGLLNNNNLIAWETKTSNRLKTIRLGDAEDILLPRDIALSADDKMIIVSAANKDKLNYIKSFDFSSGILIDSMQYNAGRIILNKDSKSLLVSNGGTLSILNLKTLQQKVIAIFKSDTNKALVNNPVYFKNYSHGIIRDYF